ncbi:uncharacterized protein LOC124283924 [Haliotis rubra]|uniref:uncharacterized protein LOC124283924 n=1 Tax=Haliotis rubra TaxID=36100 RepID=UPI001EE61E12|nr:uncharacterized protein LOC124283924 [Haliotis rubra]
MTSKGFSLVVLLTILQSGNGEDYLVAVSKRGKYGYIMYSAGETGGLLEIQYPHLAYRSVYVLSPFYLSLVGVNDQIKITTNVENAAFIVSGSDEDVNIVVYADGIFSPLPISALGTKYVLPSSLPPNGYYQSLLLIATHNISTTVDILFRLNRGSIYILNYYYSDGERLSFKLNPYQTLWVSTPYDLNGTVITSEHSIAVHSGMEYAYKYTVYDQLLPVKHYGQEYVVAVDDTKLELQIISEHSHVQITFSSGATASTGERRLYNRSLERGESFHFTATRPVLVTLSRADGYSSAFTTVPPVHSYVTHTGVWLYYNNVQTKLKVLTDTRATVLIKDKEVNDRLTWRWIAGSRYKVGTLVQSKSRYIYSTSISSDFPFTVLSFYNGSVYAIGYNLSAEEPEHYTGPSYLMALAGYSGRDNNYIPRILASAGETGGQWQVQDPRSGRVWSRRFNPHNTDYFYPIVHDKNRLILVLVFVRDDTIQIKGGMNFYTLFSPLSVSALGTKYIMSSCLPTDNIHLDTTSYIFVLVIATHSKEADIDVIFRLDANVTYGNKTYIDGDILTVRLDKYQTFSLNSSSDMTRTIVNATETIAVYSGTYDVSRTLFITFEQLLPVKHYGHEYILAIQDPYYGDRSYVSAMPYQLQVVTDHSDTSIMFDNGSSISVGEDGVYRTQCGNRETFYLNTTRPVMATLCTLGRYYYSDAFVVVPPVSLYSTLTTLQPRGTVQILTDQENNNVDVQQTHGTLSTVLSPPVTWKNLSGTRYKVGTLRGSRYTTTIRSNSTFAVLGYYAAIYNGGYSFGTYSDTETSTPDGSGVKLNTGGSIQETSTPDGRAIKLNTETSTPDGSGIKSNSGGSFQTDSPNNAAVIVGVVCGIVIVALLVAFAAYVFYTRRKMKPVAEQGADAPSISRNIYVEPDIVAGGAAGEDTCMETYINSTPCDININDISAQYFNFEC